MSQVLDKIEATAGFDERGNLPRGENGDRLPPAAPATENTAAPQPSPDPAAAPAAKAAPAEDKSGAAAPAQEPAAGTPPAKPADTTDDAKLESAEEAALKEKYSKPGDKTGNEWQIRAYRDGEKVKKSLAPVQEIMDRIASPDRARRGLDFTADYADPEVPIANAVDKMTALSTSRFDELQSYLYNYALDNHADVVATDLVGEKATAAELKEGLALLRSGAKTGVQPQSPTTTKATEAPTAEVKKPKDMSDDDWEDLTTDPGLKPAYELLKAQQAALAAAQKPAETKEPELSPAEKQLKEIQDKQREEFVNKKVEEIALAGQKMHDDIYGKVVDTGLRDLGLVPDPAKDDEKTVKLKERTAKRIREGVEPEFDGPDDEAKQTEEQKLNRKLAEKVIKLLAAGDIVAARDYEDRIAAQVDLAFQRVVEQEIELYNAAMLQSTTPKPRDGSQHQRPELVGGTAPGGTPANKTPWLDEGYRQPGETSQQAMMRYLESTAA